jgi:hypothetical protein
MWLENIAADFLDGTERLDLISSRASIRLSTAFKKSSGIVSFPVSAGLAGDLRGIKKAGF